MDILEKIDFIVNEGFLSKIKELTVKVTDKSPADLRRLFNKRNELALKMNKKTYNWTSEDWKKIQSVFKTFVENEIKMLELKKDKTSSDESKKKIDVRINKIKDYSKQTLDYYERQYKETLEKEKED